MKKLLFLFTCAVALAACGEKEDPYTREQKEIDEYFASEKLNFYKAFKVGIRGTKTTGQNPALDSARAELFALTGFVLEKTTDTTRSIDPLEAYELMSKAKPAIEELIKTDEDSLPTMMENIAFVLGPDSAAISPLEASLNESEEHLVITACWFATSTVQPDLALYELSRVKTAHIRDPNFKCVAEMARSLLYLGNKWPYHAEESADAFLALTESEKDALIADPWPMVDAKGNPVTPEQSWHQLRAIGFMLRGVARETCEEDEKKEQATGDLETFLSEAEAGGLDHKLVDLVGVLVGLKKEDADMATMYIEKLEARPDLTQEERDIIAEVKPLVAAMKAGEAQSSITKAGLLTKFAGGLFANQFMNLPVVKKLQSSEAGKKFISITKIPSEELIPGGDAIDSLKQDAEGLIDKVF